MKEGSRGQGEEWVAPDLYLAGGWAEAGETPACRSISWDRKGNIWGCQRVKQLICDSLNGLRIIETIHAVVLRTLNRETSPLKCTVAGSRSMGIGERSQGKDSCWLWKDGQRGWERGSRWWGVPLEECWAAMEAGCWVIARGGAIMVTSLSPHTSDQ